jgi:hypothetical protein
MSVAAGVCAATAAERRHTVNILRPAGLLELNHGRGRSENKRS